MEERKCEGAHVAFVGDTPAVNKVGGFKESLSRTLRICCHCMATSIQVQTGIDHSIQQM